MHTFSPLVYETPRTMKLYRQMNSSMDNTPNQKKNMIFSLINSPMDPISMNTRRLLLLNNTDVMTEFIGNHYMQIEPKYKIPHYSNQKPMKPTHHSNSVKKEKEPVAVAPATGFEIYKEKEVLKTVAPAPVEVIEPKEAESQVMVEEKKKKVTLEPLKDITSKFLSKNACEIRKRKRKSNQQLKILKWEFEKDGIWNKDKILNMSKITGLSESQVYKWCWDQKKKKTDNGSRHDSKEDGDLSDCEDDDKENMQPITDAMFSELEAFQLSKQSKSITKLKHKNTRTLQPTKSIQKLKMRNLSGGNTFKFETVNKKIDFDME